MFIRVKNGLKVEISVHMSYKWSKGRDKCTFELKVVLRSREMFARVKNGLKGRDKCSYELKMVLKSR